MTLRLNPADLSQTRADLGLTKGTSDGNVIAADATGLPAINGSQVTALNASALASGTVPTARLGSGTASSSTFLAGDQTYKTVSAGLNLLATATADNSSASLDFTSILTDTYDTYLVTFNRLIPAVNNSEFVMLFSTDNGSSFVTSNYKFNLKHFYTGPSGDGNSESTSSSSIRLALAVYSISDEGGMNGHIYIHAPTNSATPTVVTWHSHMRMGDGSNTSAQLIGGAQTSAGDHDAFRIKNESGNIAFGTVRVYGLAS